MCFGNPASNPGPAGTWTRSLIDPGPDSGPSFRRDLGSYKLSYVTANSEPVRHFSTPKPVEKAGKAAENKSGAFERPGFGCLLFILSAAKSKLAVFQLVWFFRQMSCRFAVTYTKIFARKATDRKSVGKERKLFPRFLPAGLRRGW